MWLNINQMKCQWGEMSIRLRKNQITKAEHSLLYKTNELTSLPAKTNKPKLTKT